MSGAPEVSVLMPVGPAAPFLEQALESVRDQTVRTWELVAVLDGAGQAGERLLRRLIPADRLTVVRHAVPQGVAPALAAGLRRCRADLVARMDADDICLPHRFERQQDFLARNPDVVVAGSAVHIIDEHGRRRYVQPARAKGDLRRRLLLRNQLIHPSVMFRREAVEGIGGYDQRLSGGEDFELWLRLCAVGPLICLPEPLLEYRVWEQQYSRTVEVGPLMPDLLAARRLAARSLGAPPGVALAAHSVWRLAQSRTAHGLLRRARALTRRYGGNATVTEPARVPVPASEPRRDHGVRYMSKS